MRIATVIIAHKNPGQLEKLIMAMRHPDFDFYIHLDKKVTVGPFEQLAALKQVYFIKDRVVCNWGGFGIVHAIINSMGQIQLSGIAYDFVNLISGQDFPVKPIPEIHSFFDNYRGFSFLSFDSTNDTAWWKEAEDRYKKFHFTDMNFRGKYLIQRIANAIRPNRKFPLPLRLYGGNKSTWWTVTYDASLYLSAYFKANPRVIDFLKYSWCSDEFIIATILMNSPFRDKIINENYRYIDWSAGNANPEILTINDYNKIIRSEMLFARKFDTNVDAEVLDKLYTYVSGSDFNVQD